MALRLSGNVREAFCDPMQQIIRLAFRATGQASNARMVTELEESAQPGWPGTDKLG